MKKILAFLGPQGTFTYQAAQIYIKNLPLNNSYEHSLKHSYKQSTEYSNNPSYKLTPYSCIPGILDAVEHGKVDLGIVPAENSIEGGVNITLDTLAHELNLYIQREVILDITHHLLSFMTSFKDIHTVISHQQAIAQCRNFLRKHLPHATLLETKSTAEAVQKMNNSTNANNNTKQNNTSNNNNKNGIAAIASSDCHLRYKVPILSRNIGDFPHNQTRFLVVGKTPCPLPGTHKTSLVVFPRGNKPGSLYEILETFAKRNINLSKIESRPIKKELGMYLFFIDCEDSFQSPNLQEALIDLEKKTTLLKNLGSYSTCHL